MLFGRLGFGLGRMGAGRRPGGAAPVVGSIVAARILPDGWTAEIDVFGMSADAADPTLVSGTITLPATDALGVSFGGSRAVSGATTNYNTWYDANWPFPDQSESGGVLTIPIRLDKPARAGDSVALVIDADLIPGALAGAVTATNGSVLEHMRYAEELYTDANTLVANVDVRVGCRKTTGFMTPQIAFDGDGSDWPTATPSNIADENWNNTTKELNINNKSDAAFIGWDFRGTHVRTNNTANNLQFIDCLFDGDNATSISAQSALEFYPGAQDYVVDHCTFTGSEGASGAATGIRCRQGGNDGGSIAFNLMEKWNADPIDIAGGSASDPLECRSNWLKSGGFAVGSHFDNIAFNHGYANIKYNLCDQRSYGVQYGKTSYVNVGTYTGGEDLIALANVIGNVGVGKAGDISYPFQAYNNAINGGVVSNVTVEDNIFAPSATGTWYHPNEEGIVACSGNKNVLTNAALSDIPLSDNHILLESGYFVRIESAGGGDLSSSILMEA